MAAVTDDTITPVAPPLPNPEARLVAIIESADDAIISKDVNGYVMSWNPAAERMFGYTAEEAIGRHITLIIPEDRLDEEDFVLERVRAGVGVSHYETTRRRKDGSPIEVSLTVSPIRAPDGTIVGASKIARDITEQRRLRQAADEASRLKDEFLALLSHELRTPLNTVLGYARMLRKDDIPLTPEQRERALEVLERNADALAKLVADVLDTSRVITGKLRLTTTRFALDEIVREAVETVRPTADAKGVRLEMAIDESLFVTGDPDRMRQVTWNLLSNAIKFTPDGGLVHVEAKRSGSEIVLRVRDTGIGIDEKDLPYVFQRFWQADAGHTRIHGGLGLGLALARHLTELHGGTIAAESEGRDRGATFTVRLPSAAPVIAAKWPAAR
jgi:PAS domain S-box-containing protein